MLRLFGWLVSTGCWRHKRKATGKRKIGCGCDFCSRKFFILGIYKSEKMVYVLTTFFNAKMHMESYAFLWRSFRAFSHKNELHITSSFENVLYLRKDEEMKEIFQEYGGVLITVVAILAVILVITAVVGNDASGPIGTAFSNLINNFIAQANANTGISVGK